MNVLPVVLLLLLLLLLLAAAVVQSDVETSARPIADKTGRVPRRQCVVERFQDLPLRAHFGISTAPNAQTSPKVSNKDYIKSGAANIDHS